MDIKEKLKQAITAINEAYKKSGLKRDIVFLAGEHPERLKPEFISTGHEEWDIPLRGGIPKGGVTTIHGSPWSGKTAFALGVASTLLRQNKYVLYVNLEGIKLDAYSHIIGEEGSDLRHFLVEMGPGLTAEYTISDIEKLLYDRDTKQPAGIFDLIIIDSINNLHTEAKEKAWLEGPEKIPQMGSRAKLLDDFLTRLYGKGMMGENGTAIILIAQDRANIAGASMPMAAKTVISGGESIKFNAKLMLKVARKINAAKTGQDVTLTIEKNSMTGLLGEGVVSIIYKKGKDDTQALIDKAREFKYLIPGSSKTSNILILPGLGDLEISAVKKTADTKAKTLKTVIEETVRNNPEIAECLRTVLAPKKPAEGVRQNYVYELNKVATEEVETEEEVND
jgi:RecA/RadA recombinase